MSTANPSGTLVNLRPASNVLILQGTVYVNDCSTPTDVTRAPFQQTQNVQFKLNNNTLVSTDKLVGS